MADAGHSAPAAKGLMVRLSMTHVAVMIVFIMLCGGLLHLWADYRHTLANAAFSMATMVRAVDQHLGGSIRAVDNLLLDVAGTVRQGRHTSPAFQNQMLTRLATFPEIRYIGIVTPDGVLQPETWPQIAIPQTGLNVSVCISPGNSRCRGRIAW
jgi:hypothetical protein